MKVSASTTCSSLGTYSVCCLKRFHTHILPSLTHLYYGSCLWWWIWLASICNAKNPCCRCPVWSCKQPTRCFARPVAPTKLLQKALNTQPRALSTGSAVFVLRVLPTKWQPETRWDQHYQTLERESVLGVWLVNCFFVNYFSLVEDRWILDMYLRIPTYTIRFRVQWSWHPVFSADTMHIGR